MSPSAPSTNNTTQSHMVENRHYSSRVARRELLLEFIDQKNFDYQEKRSKGLIPPNDEARWGLEDPGAREYLQTMNCVHVTQSFFKINWNEGYTGRGVVPRNGQTLADDPLEPLEGPMGESVEDITGAEPPTSRRDREMWQAANKSSRFEDPFDLGSRSQLGGEDEDGPLEDVEYAEEDEEQGPFGKRRNEEEGAGPSNDPSNEEDIGSLDGPSEEDDLGTTDQTRQRIQLQACGNMQNSLVDFANQAFQILGEDQTSPPARTRQQLELDLSGEMTDALLDIQTEANYVPGESEAGTKTSGSSGANLSTNTTFSNRKRRKNSSDDLTTAPTDEASGVDLDTPCPSPKRPRVDISEKVSDDESGVDTSPSKLNSMRIIRKEKTIKSRKARSILTGFGERGSQVSRVSTGATDFRGHESDIPAPEIPAVDNSHGQKRKRGEMSQPTLKRTDKLNPDALMKDVFELRQMIANYAAKIPPKPTRASAARGSTDLDKDGLRDSDNESDDEWQPRQKRPRHERALDQTRMSDASHNGDGEASLGVDHITTTVRPTFEGIRTRIIPLIDVPFPLLISDDNEVEDVVITHLMKVEAREYEYPPGLPSRIEPVARPWDEEDDETLRSWVQDFGIKSWEQIAWCLHRSEEDCRERYPKIVKALNRRAERELNAGLPGWKDEDLHLTTEDIAELARRRAVEKAKKKAAEDAKEREAAEIAEALRQAEEADNDGMEAGAESESEEEPDSNEVPKEDEQPIVRSGAEQEGEVESEAQAGAEEEEESEPEFVSEKKVKIEEEEDEGYGTSLEEDTQTNTMSQHQPANIAPRAAPQLAPTAVPLPAAPLSPGSQSELPRLRPRKPRANAKFGTCGQILYNPNAKSFPRRTEMGALIDAKGDLLPNNEQETALSLGQLLPPKVVRNRKPRSGNAAGAVVMQARITKPQRGNGARQFGVDRRVGRGKR